MTSRGSGGAEYDSHHRAGSVGVSAPSTGWQRLRARRRSIRRPRDPDRGRRARAPRRRARGRGPVRATHSALSIRRRLNRGITESGPGVRARTLIRKPFSSEGRPKGAGRTTWPGVARSMSLARDGTIRPLRSSSGARTEAPTRVPEGDAASPSLTVHVQVSAGCESARIGAAISRSFVQKVPRRKGSDATQENLSCRRGDAPPTADSRS